MGLIKKLNKKLYRYVHIFMNRFLFLRSPVFQDFLQSTDKQRIVLLDTPIHGNLGDQAIVIAEKQFLNLIFPLKKIYEFTQQDYLSCEKEIIASLHQDDIILIHGGGFIGTLWPTQEKVFLRILKKLSTHKITVFPQTVYFEHSKKGQAAGKECKKIINKCSDLCLLTRERQSHNILTRELRITPEQCFCVPDIVTFLRYKETYERTDKVLLCLRNDLEKVMEENELAAIQKELTKRNLEFEYTDTVIRHKGIVGKEREELVNKKLTEFARCKFMITDRLHGMLMAAITGTPCMFMDNYSRKVSGTYEWIKYLEYIKPLTDIDSLNSFISSLEDGTVYHYNNEPLQKYYKKMSEIIMR